MIAYKNKNIFNNYFDCIYSTSVLEHITDANLFYARLKKMPEKTIFVLNRKLPLKLAALILFLTSSSFIDKLLDASVSLSMLIGLLVMMFLTRSFFRLLLF